MDSYTVDLDRQVWQNLPVRLRQDVEWAWLKALIQPVKDVYVLFTDFRNSKLYELAHNSQVCFLQAALNDLFDAGLRRITISDPEWHDPLYVYRVDEDKPVWLALDSEVGGTAYDSPVYLFTDAETVDIISTFIVNVPSGLAYDADQMRALIGKYKLVGTNYVIVVF